jgi:cell division protein FtsI (penicillin-binding protein 3)
VYTSRYAASFAGIFPARDPQLVVVVRIEVPQGAEYYGGLVAAPLTARMLRQALAVRSSAIDRSRLADDVVAARRASPAAHPVRPPAVVTWPPKAGRRPRTDPAEVPDVVGESPRAAALSLHRRGFRVRLEGAGRVVATIPRAGDSLGRGRTVTVVAKRGG